MVASAPLIERVHGELSSAVSAGARFATEAPPPWAALLVGVGVLFLLHGARHRHVLAVPGGVALGLVVARLAMTALEGAGGAVHAEAYWIAGGVGGVACAAWPPLFPALALAIPGFLIGWQYPIALRPWLGAAAGAVVGAAVGGVLREWVAALAAGGIGGAAAIAGGLGLLAKQPVGGVLRDHPMALLATWAVLAVAGAAFHAGRAWPARGSERGGPDRLQPRDDRSPGNAEADR